VIAMRKLLIANRGEIAARIMRTAHDLGIATVAVYADPDADAPHVSLADEAVHLAGTASYRQGDRIIAAARATGADAIHPGYGFLAENAVFARDVAAAGLTFVGPSAEAIAAMGSKIGAKALMEAAGVPILPGGTVTADSDLPGLAAAVGFPLLVKASAGGGGRGMRLVEGPEALGAAVAAARSEAASAFGDGAVFLERYVVDPRHVEVQIVGDTRGTVVHLFERECSIQRRYQKIVEEAPSPAVDDELRAALGAAAVAAGKAIGYVGAGTVEFVLDREGDFFFLEVNTRLQVEHPVTELVTGLDLVEIQLRVADGEPLPPAVLEAELTGHAIEARLYAEDPAAGFRPSTGTLDRFAIPTGPGVRVDAGYRDRSVVSPHYDALLAKVIGYGRTRDDAARRLARALKHAQLHGVITNRDLLVGILGEDEFRAGRTDTGYLTRHDPATLAAPDPASTAVHALAAALARRAENRAAAPMLGTLPSGWRNVRSRPARVGYEGFDVEYTRDSATVNGSSVGVVRLHRATPDEVDLEIDGVRRIYRVHRAGRVYVDGGGFSSALTERPRFPDPVAAGAAGSLLAPMPGMVVSVLAKTGDRVDAGQPLLVLEAMKMQQTVAAPAAGTLTELRVAVGEQVDTGTVLAVVEAADAR
jgi:propionyl-CoA carboxylase alpha chain